MKQEGIFTPNGMPVEWQNYKFSWDKDLYHKKIMVKKKGAKKAPFDADDSNSPFPERILSALKQLAMGGQVYRAQDESSAEAFILKHQIKVFDDKLNKQLSQKYGLGFASSVYQSLLNQKSENILFKKLVDKNLSPVQAQAVEKITFIIARGYAHTVMGNDLFRYLKEDLSLMGYEVIMAETDGFGTLEQNEKILLNLFEEQMALDKKIVLIGTCVGLVASLGALEQIKMKTHKVPLMGLINIAGMLKGSFVVDWATRMPQWFFIKRGLYKEYKSKGGAPEKLSALEAMKDFRFERIGGFMNKIGHQSSLSSKTLNLVSILPHSGLGREKSGIRRMQDEVIRPNLKKNTYGANDGVIEYPGTVLDDKLTNKNMSLIFESSHNFLDGYFDSFGKRFDLRNDQERRQIFGSVIQSFLAI